MPRVGASNLDGSMLVRSGDTNNNRIFHGTRLNVDRQLLDVLNTCLRILTRFAFRPVVGASAKKV